MQHFSVVLNLGTWTSPFCLASALMRPAAGLCALNGGLQPGTRPPSSGWHT